MVHLFKLYYNLYWYRYRYSVLGRNTDLLSLFVKSRLIVQVIQLNRRLETATYNAESAAAEILRLEASSAAEQEKNAALGAELAKLHDVVAAERRQRAAEAQQLRSQIGAEEERGNVRYEQVRHEAQATIKEVTSQCHQLQAEMASAHSAITSLTAELQRVREEVRERELAQQETDTVFDELMAQRDGLNDELAQAKSTCQALQQEMAAVKSRSGEQQLLEQSVQQQQQLEQLQQQLADYTRKMKVRLCMLVIPPIMKLP